MPASQPDRPRPGFRSFASAPLAIALWLVTASLTALFVALGWSSLQIALVVLPLLAVTIATSAAVARRPRSG